MDWRPWMDAFLPPLLEALPGRVAFVGIQGSFGRGEAGPESDVDLVVVLDALGAAELAACRGVLEKMPFADRACGFFCDRAALAAWPAFDALQLKLDTLPVYGSLEELLPPMGEETLDEAVRAAASALYHAACHTALFDAQPEAALPALQKAAFFALRLAHCRRSGQYTAARQALLPSWSRRSGPCWGRIAPCPPSWRGPGRDGILTQALPGCNKPRAESARGL
ncbi:MAG: nucleotidyltransferase domain-containing protein [Flavonifractor plautii]